MPQITNFFVSGHGLGKTNLVPIILHPLRCMIMEQPTEWQTALYMSIIDFR